MILGILDFESTGLDILQDRVVEVGQVMYSTAQRRILEAGSFLVATDKPIPKDAEKVHGILNAATKKYGYDDKDSLFGLLEWLGKLDAVAGQNILMFDWPLLQNWARHYSRVLPALLVIDTEWDLPGVKGKHLQYMAADDGFLNMFPHGALADCLTALKLIENRLTVLDKIVERAKSPLLVLQSLQDRDHNDQAKERDFHWSSDNKIWWKACKEIDVENIAKECSSFDICVRRDLDLRRLWS